MTSANKSIPFNCITLQWQFLYVLRVADKTINCTTRKSFLVRLKSQTINPFFKHSSTCKNVRIYISHSIAASLLSICLFSIGARSTNGTFRQQANRGRERARDLCEDVPPDSFLAVFLWWISLHVIKWSLNLAGRCQNQPPPHSVSLLGFPKQMRSLRVVFSYRAASR